MTQRESQRREAASAKTLFSISIQLPRDASRATRQSLLLTLTSAFDLNVDLEDPLLRDWIDHVVGADDFPSAFARLLEVGDVATEPQPLAGSDTEVATDKSFEQLLSITVNDGKSQPIRYLNRPESQVYWQRMKVARLRARFVAVLLVEILTRIGSKYRADLNVVSPAFRAQFISDRDARNFARSLHCYWEGYYDDAARIALPSIEAVIRSIVQTTHGDSYVEPRRGRDGHESTLGRLISMLDPTLPESFRCELSTILTDPLGLNLRNVHLHGLAPVDPKHDAAIILYTAARLTLISAYTPA